MTFADLQIFRSVYAYIKFSGLSNHRHNLRSETHMLIATLSNHQHNYRCETHMPILLFRWTKALAHSSQGSSNQKRKIHASFWPLLCSLFFEWVRTRRSFNGELFVLADCTSNPSSPYGCSHFSNDSWWWSLETIIHETCMLVYIHSSVNSRECLFDSEYTEELISDWYFQLQHK